MFGGDDEITLATWVRAFFFLLGDVFHPYTCGLFILHVPMGYFRLTSEEGHSIPVPWGVLRAAVSFLPKS